MEFGTAFLLGFAGSVHCAGMCGPLLIALAKARPATAREAAGRVFHHLGRLASYCALGSAAGLAGDAATPAGFQRWLSITLGAALAASFLISSRSSPGAHLFKGWGWLRIAMQRLAGRNSPGAHAAMGALHGLLPCGLAYAAAAGAAATGDAVKGAVCMVLFGLGTWPVTLGIHLAGHRLPLPSRLRPGSIARAAVLVMAATLLLRGLELGIPYVSPGPAAAPAGRCH